MTIVMMRNLISICVLWDEEKTVKLFLKKRTVVCMPMLSKNNVTLCQAWKNVMNILTHRQQSLRTLMILNLNCELLRRKQWKW